MLPHPPVKQVLLSILDRLQILPTNFKFMKKNSQLFSKAACISLFLILSVFAHFPVAAQSLPTTTVNLGSRTVTIEKFFSEIESQTKCLVVYSQAQVDPSESITFSTASARLGTLLNEFSTAKGLKYEYSKGYITFSKREPSQPIKGKVVSSNGEPIIGAGITLKGSPTVGAVSDLDGGFVISVEPGESLIVSSIGYKGVEMAAAQNMVVTLSEDVDELNEVVIVGYGTQKKVNLTGSIATMDSKTIEDRPITSSSQVLQGMLGVYVNQAGGQPGFDGATIRVRGQGTLNNNNPLILVDGIEFPLDAINPNDIESISVLKDAASSAIYGSRAANGVILVKTKAGNAMNDGKFTIEYSDYFGFQQATYLPDFVYDPIVFMETRNQAQRNAGKLTVDYSDAIIEEYRQGMLTDPITYQNNNWLDIMFNNAFIMEHNLRFSGGTDKYTYSVSGGYTQQDGVLRGSGSDIFNFSVNTTAQVTPRLKIGANVNAQYKLIDAPVSGVSNLMQMTFKATAFHPTYTADGRYANTFIRTPGHNKYRHPLALADEGERKRSAQRALINLSAEYRLPLDVVYNLNVGVNKYDYLMSIFAPDIYTYNLKTDASERVNFDDWNTRQAYREDENDLAMTIFNTLTWAHQFSGKHDVKAMAGYSYESNQTKVFTAKIEGFLGNDLRELNAGTANAQVTGTSSKSVRMSYFGRLNYSFLDRYLFEANLRYDGSSRFAKGHRWGIFPSFSAGWRISEEPFMKQVDWVDNLKVRASWGKLGNSDIEMFRYVDLVNIADYTYALNGKIQNGAAVDAYNDPNISWETTTMTDIGLDASLYSGRLTFSLDLFDKKTSDILRTVTLPSQIGDLKGPIRNIGDVSNKGIEVMLGWRDDIGKFHYGISGSAALIKNRITNLNGDTTIDGMFILKEGEAIDSYYMLHNIGIFQSQEEIDNSPFQTSTTRPGYLKFEDVNKDGKITEEDRKIVGTVIPKANYAFNIRVGYGPVDLEAMFQGVAGVKAYADKMGSTPFWFGCGLTNEWLTDSWTPERGESARLPIITCYEDSLNDNVRTNDFWLKDASYLRLKNIQLSYRLPVKLFHNTVKGVKIFANAQNALTFTKMKDFDPEMNLKNGTYYQYPSVRMFSAGVNVSF